MEAKTLAERIADGEVQSTDPIVKRILAAANQPADFYGAGFPRPTRAELVEALGSYLGSRAKAT